MEAGTHSNPFVFHLAKLTSFVLHPLWMTCYANALLLFGGTFMSYTVGPAMQRFIMSLLVLGTLLLPVIVTLLLWRVGSISSLESPKRHERHAPFVLTLLCYAGVLFVLWKLPVPRLVGFITAGGSLAILASFLINLRWKISIHMTGIGGLLGILGGMQQHYFQLQPLIFVALILGAGLLGSSRMILKAHTPAQVYLGLLSGFFIELAYCYWGLG